MWRPGAGFQCPLWWTNGDALTPPAMSCDSTCKVLSTRDVHKRFGAQDFHWGLVKWAPSAQHVRTFPSSRKKTDIKCKQGYDDTKGAEKAPAKIEKPVPGPCFTPDLLSSSSSQQLGIHLKRQPGQCLLAACLILSKNRRGDQAPDALPHRWRNFLLLPNPLSGLSPPPSFSLLPCCFSPLMCNIFAFFF